MGVKIGYIKWMKNPLENDWVNILVTSEVKGSRVPALDFVSKS